MVGISSFWYSAEQEKKTLLWMKWPAEKFPLEKLSKSHWSEIISILNLDRYFLANFWPDWCRMDRSMTRYSIWVSSSTNDAEQSKVAARFQKLFDKSGRFKKTNRKNSKYPNTQISTQHLKSHHQDNYKKSPKDYYARTGSGTRAFIQGLIGGA